MSFDSPYLEVVEVVPGHALDTIIYQATKGALASAGEATLQRASASILPADVITMISP